MKRFFQYADKAVEYTSERPEHDLLLTMHIMNGRKLKCQYYLELQDAVDNVIRKGTVKQFVPAARGKHVRNSMTNNNFKDAFLPK